MVRLGLWPQSHHLVNLSAAYSFSVGSPPDRSEQTGSITIQWGKPFLHDGVNDTGIQIICDDQHDARVGHVDSHFVTFLYPKPLDGIGSFVFGASGNGWVASLKGRITWHNRKLVLNGNCTAQLTFDSLDLEVDDGAGFAVVYTLTGPFTINVTGFDKRKDTSNLQVTATYSPANLPLDAPACSTNFASAPNFDDKTNASVVGGWEDYDGAVWRRQTVSFYGYVLTNTIGCPCFQNPAGAGGGNSYSITISTSYEDKIVSTFVSNSDYCAGGGSSCFGTDFQDVWTQAEPFLTYSASCNCVSNDWGILQLHLHTLEQCNASPPVFFDQDLSFGTTYSEETRSVELSSGSITCHARTSGHCSCTPPDGPHYPPPNKQFCLFQGAVVLSWPVKPPCGGVIDVDDLQTDQGEHYIAYTSSGDLWSAWCPNTQVTWKVQTNITGASVFTGGWARPRICIDTSSALRLELLAYHTNQGGADTLATGLYRFWSTDDGRTWGPIAAGILAPELISASATSGMTRIARDGPMMRIVFIPDAGVTGPGTFQSQFKPVADAAWSAFTTIKDQAGANLHSRGYAWGFDHMGDQVDRWALTFVASGGANLVEYFCSNKGLTWDLMTTVAAASATDALVRCDRSGPLIRIVGIPDAGTSGPATFKSQYKPLPDVAWSALTVMKDQAAANIHSAGYQWGFDHAFEGPDRWSLSLVNNGDSVVSTYMSANTGTTADLVM